VRWTEKRNFEAVLEAIKNENLKVKDLITERVVLEDFKQIYNDMSSNKSIASILLYPELDRKEKKSNTIKLDNKKYSLQNGVVGIIGSGNFTNRTVLPSLKGSGARLKMIASSGGLSGTNCAKNHGISQSTTDYKEILYDQEIDTVLITTRHDSHAKLVLESLKAGKNIFVEKPLALNRAELDQIIESYYNQDKKTKRAILMVGYNRRFSPHLIKVKKSMGSNIGAINIIANMNAGFISKSHWTHDLDFGGGRIIAEACHLMDICVFLSNSLISSVCMSGLGNSPKIDTDNAIILLKFKNGSNAVVNYFSNGSKKYSKERVEVYSQERTWIVDNYRKTEGFGIKRFKTLKTKLDKGHKNQFHKFIKQVQKGGEPLIYIEELFNVTKASFAAIKSMKTNTWIDV